MGAGLPDRSAAGIGRRRLLSSRFVEPPLEVQLVERRSAG
jgi:hypothetical protein